MDKNAIDYLIEFTKDSECNDWLSYVIKFFISKKGVIDDNDKNNLVDYLLKRKKIPEIPDPKSTNLNLNNKKIILRNLKHNSGVNALSEDQEIIFSPELNIIYGLNGTGKSSYFRILNNISGYANPKTILHNIYIDSPKNISVNIEYAVDNVNKSTTWSNTSNTPDFRSIRVFDTDYTNNYLQKRDTDELMIKPYALSYFSEVTDLILEVKKIAETRIELDTGTLPKLDLSKTSISFQEFLTKDWFEDSDFRKINEFKNIDSEEKLKLAQLKTSIAALNKENSEDSIKLNEVKLNNLKKVEMEFKNLIKRIREEEEKVSDLITEKEKLVKENSLARQQFKVFSKIPGVGSEVWTNFIKSGIHYCDNFDLDEKCPYCHRTYDENSLKMVEAYTQFIRDNTQTQLDKKLKEIQNKISVLQSLRLTNFEDLQITNEKLVALETLKEQLVQNRDLLLRKLRGEEEVEVPKIEETLLENLSKEIGNTQELLTNLQSDSLKKEKDLSEYSKQLILLEEKISLSSQFLELKNFVKKKNKLFLERKYISDINISKVTFLSRKAHKELLTENLLKTFKQNLKNLGQNHLSIQLKGSNSKGRQQTELILANNKNVKDILSEGEQKATALALFISEISLSNNQSTIIFDDPVNSLDHRIMNKFSELLMSLENQIVIFTHNKMFLDYFEVSSLTHICKNLDGGCNKGRGKHCYLYETLSDGQNEKGIIVVKRNENLKKYLADIDRLLKNSPFTDEDKILACAKLRKSVEFAIDEIILNNQVPTKYSNKNSRINWENLKNIENDSTIIDKLHAIHGRCSGGTLHNGTESDENPIDKEELNKMFNDIKDIQSNH